MLGWFVRGMGRSVKSLILAMKYPFQLWHVGIVTALLVLGVVLASFSRRDFGLLSNENIDKSRRLITQAEYEALFGPPNSRPHRREFRREPDTTVISWEEQCGRKGPYLNLLWLDVCFDAETGKQIEHVWGAIPFIAHPSCMESKKA
jgi:hypothetical protein